MAEIDKTFIIGRNMQVYIGKETLYNWTINKESGLIE